MKEIVFLGSTLKLPLQFSTQVPFSANEKNEKFWLKNSTRYYNIERELNPGGTANAYLGFVCDESGQRLADTPNIVIKIPSLNPAEYSMQEIKDYLLKLANSGGDEWQLTRMRLENSKYANPVFDFCIQSLTVDDTVLLYIPITAQLFLEEALSLDQYLIKSKDKTEGYSKDGHLHIGTSDDHWHGIANPIKWLDIAKIIAEGLADIHHRRVVHGDIWPPNIFIKEVSAIEKRVIFIDFGEAFPIEPTGLSQEMRNHPYRAPERSNKESIVTQKADIYSFGKLLLYLATGGEPVISQKYKGHERRKLIREKFKNRNPRIVEENPFIIDLVCKCISLDPIDRPSITEIIRALNSYVDIRKGHTSFTTIKERLDTIYKIWATVQENTANRNQKVSAYLEELVEQRLLDVQETIAGLENDAVFFDNRRERLILDLLCLFKRLNKGDRFVSITHPRMWQASALGLDGRYLTATELAAVRGASIQRVFLISIQEIGLEWAEEWATNLERIGKNNKNDPAIKLSELIKQKIKHYNADYEIKNEKKIIPKNLLVAARKRLVYVIESYLDSATGIGICKGLFNKSNVYEGFLNTSGIFVGLIIVSTLAEMRALKSSYPLSVFYFSNETEEREKYILMRTDCVARSYYGGNEDDNIDDISFMESKPELRGLSVFKSVYGVPQNRILELEKKFRQSINVGYWSEELCKSFPEH